MSGDLITSITQHIDVKSFCLCITVFAVANKQASINAQQ